MTFRRLTTISRVLGALVLTAGAALWAAGGCRQVLGVEEREVERRQCRVYDFGGDGSCTTCMDDCCDEATACRADPTCDLVATCEAACTPGDGNAACRSTCQRKEGCTGADCTLPVTPALAALRACAANRCEEACGLSCGGLGPPQGDAEGATGCECADACCVEVAACAREVDCGSFDGCRSSCGPAPEAMACREHCATTHVTGASLRRAIDECVARNCTPGADWSCVGETAWRRPDPGTENIDIDLDIFAESVTACLDGGCLNGPMGTGLSLIKLTVPVGDEGGYRGPLLVTFGNLVLAQPEFLHYLFPPVIRDKYIGGFGPWSVAKYAETVGVELDPDKGHLQVYATDCRGRSAPGVSVQIEPLEPSAPALPKPYYALDGGSYPSQVEWSLTATQTGTLSAALFLNLPPGAVHVTGTVNGSCRRSSRVTEIRIRQATLTVLDLPPTPLE